jgi:DNA repair exonuclease SbcCD nuclease subunit
MKALVFTDLHIKESELSECQVILDELLSIATEQQVELIINLGDTFDNIHPSSNSLDLYANFCTRWGKEIIMLSALSHESTNEESSVLNHFGILNKNVHIYPMEYVLNGILFGHYMLQESEYGFEEKRTAKELKEYKLVLLGHQHSFQRIRSNIFHLGSSRYCTFAESDAPYKRCLVIDLNTSEIVKEIELKSAIKMEQIEVNIGKISETLSYLKTSVYPKVKLVIKDEESFKLFLEQYSSLKPRFKVLTYKIGYKKEVKESTESKVSGIKESFLTWLDKREVDSQVQDLLRKAVTLCE